MTLAELTHDQKLSLVALIELFTMADGAVTDGEVAQINRIAEGLGDDEYRQLLNESEERFVGVEELKAALLTIQDNEVRDLIFGLAMEEVMNSPSTTPTPELLEWLKEEWSIKVSDIES